MRGGREGRVVVGGIRIRQGGRVGVDMDMGMGTGIVVAVEVEVETGTLIGGVGAIEIELFPKGGGFFHHRGGDDSNMPCYYIRGFG